MTDKQKPDTSALTKLMDTGNMAKVLHAEMGVIFEEVRKDCFEAIRLSEGPDTEGRETAYHIMRAVDAAEQKIITRIGTGDAARAELKRIQKTQSEDNDAT